MLEDKVWPLAAVAIWTNLITIIGMVFENPALQSLGVICLPIFVSVTGFFLANKEGK